MKKCSEIQQCTSIDYLTCSAKMSLTNCWVLRKGCLCRKNPSLVCDRCPIYLEHQKEINGLVESAQGSDTESIDQLVEEYSRFVYQIGKKFFLPGAAREDLVQEGMIGLFNAIINYNPEFRTSFDDYASLSIRNRILRAVRMATQLKQKVLSDAFSLDEDPFYYSALFTESPVEDHVVGKLSVNELSRCFKNLLSPMEYRIISMKITDASVDEMARVFGLSRKQIENALFRSRRKISIFLRNEFDLRRNVEGGGFIEEETNYDIEMDYDSFYSDFGMNLDLDEEVDYSLKLGLDLDVDPEINLEAKKGE